MKGFDDHLDNYGNPGMGNEFWEDSMTDTALDDPNSGREPIKPSGPYSDYVMDRANKIVNLACQTFESSEYDDIAGLREAIAVIINEVVEDMY